jgi:hypothetical protein
MSLKTNRLIRNILPESQQEWRGVIVKRNGAETVAGNPLYCWVRPEAGGMALAIYNDSTPHEAGRRVLVGRDRRDRQMRVRRGVYSAGSTQTITPGVGAHAPSHYIDGTDPAYITDQQITPILCYALTGMTVHLNSGWIVYQGQAVQIASQNIDMTGSIPGSGARYSLIRVNSAGTVSVQDGTPVASFGDLTASSIPAVETGYAALAFVRLYAGQAALSRLTTNPDVKPLIWGSGLYTSIVVIHGSTHESGGGDEIVVEALLGKLADPQNAGWLRDYVIAADAPETGEVLIWDGAAYTPGIVEVTTPEVHQHIFQEDHSAECNGVLLEFATDDYFIAATTMVWLNGLLQHPGAGKDYTEDVDLLGITFATAPLTGDSLIIAYIVGEEPPPPPPEPGDFIPAGPYVVGDQDVILVMGEHIHTTNSDGSLSPSALAAALAAAGHDVLLMTDHNMVSADPGGHSLIYVRGNEITSSGGHMGSLGSAYAPGSGVNTQTAIDAIIAAGGVAILYHPNWTANWSDAEYAAYTGYHGIEIFNMHVETGASSEGISKPGFALADWEYVLQNVRRDVFAFAGDDYHYTNANKFYNTGRLIIFAEDSTEAAIITALRAGNFAADANNYGVTPGVPVVGAHDVSVVCPGATSIRFLGDTGLLEEDAGDTGSYTYTEDEEYIRIEAVGDMTEDFEDALDSRWQAYNGAWSISVDGTLYFTDGTTTPKIMCLKNFREGDFQAQFEAKATGAGASKAIGFMFNMVDVSRFYLLRFGKTAGVSSWSNKFAVGYCASTFAAPFVSVAATPVDDAWYVIKCEYVAATGTFRAKYWLRDSESEPGTWTIEGSDATWTHGQFGFRHAMGEIEIDDLYINGFKTYYQPLPLADWERVEV